MRFWKKYHRWAGIILCLFFILYALSGIILNHRSTFSSLSVPRSILSSSYQYHNWNNAAIRGTLKLNEDSTLFFGNIGCWLKGTDSIFHSFNQGFPDGIDNRKINKLFKTHNNRLFAGTLFGLYEYSSAHWQKIPLPVKHPRVTDIIENRDTLIILTRSEMCFLPLDKKLVSHSVYLPSPEGDDRKVSLFKTLWIIHSGEIAGLPSKLFVDLLGLFFVFFALTGLIWFAYPKWIKQSRNKLKPVKHKQQALKFSVKWHRKAGIALLAFMLISAVTGIFLRPPLLIAIANTKVAPIPGSHLDSPNAWFDKLRAIRYNQKYDVFLVSTSKGFFSLTSDHQKMIPIPQQPPVSVMGINIFNSIDSETYLIGSFNGLFQWNPFKMTTHNYITGKPYQAHNRPSRPIGDHMATGHYNTEDSEFYFDYNQGIVKLSGDDLFPAMPENLLLESPMSLWNFMLEIHTMRIFQDLIGPFYILIIPLTGLATVLLLFSAFRLYTIRKRKQKNVCR